MVNRTRRLPYAILLRLSPQVRGAATMGDPAAASGFLRATLIIESFPAAIASSLSAYRAVFVAPDSRVAAPFQKAAGDTDREIAVSPQLVPQNANWRDGVTERYTDERVRQINVLWWF